VSQQDFSSDDVKRLERRLAELSSEVRHYPTPIARCDEQLAALLEERTRVLEELNKNAS
jgi:chorismate mutase